MKESFRGFYNPDKEILQSAWNSDETLFVLDTNVLLNLYGYAEQTREDFFDLLKSLDKKLWIPYQVGLEYQRRRLEVIRDEKAIFNKINDNLDKIEKVFAGNFEQLALKRRFPTLHENTEKLRKEISKSISSYKKSVSCWDEKQPCVRSHDTIREKLDELTEGKIGLPPEDQEWLDKLYKEGEERYNNKIPPGYKDFKKSKSEQSTFAYNGLIYDRQYGDLILWKQLITKAENEKIKNVIFVTDDTKEDWWYILESRGKKQIGPHANLQSEIYRKANLDIFHMYNTSTFLESGKEILKLGVHDSSIQDASTMFHQSIKRVTRNLKFDLQKEELENDIYNKLIRVINNDYNKQKNCIINFKYGDLDDKQKQLLNKWSEIENKRTFFEDLYHQDEDSEDDD